MRAACALLLAIVALAVPPTARGQQPPVDVQGHWAEPRIVPLVQRGAFSLFSDLTFRPDHPITRAEFIKALVLARGLPTRAAATASFADVPVTHPYAVYVETALAYGLLSRTATFLPFAGLRRIDAILLAVQALGYAFETSTLAGRELPFDDLAGLDDRLRGAAAVAVLSSPPLLAEPPSTSLRPQAALTRAEAASLIWAVAAASERGMSLRAVLPVAAGIEFIVERRGVLVTQPVWRIQVGAFADPDNAQRLAAAMQGRGLAAAVEFQDGFYKVRVGDFVSAADARLVADQLSAEGHPAVILATLRDFDASPGPFRIAAVVIDPRAGVRLVPAAGDGQRLRRQRTSELARRLGALAAINGNFFDATGRPLGCLMIDGQVISEPNPQRSCAGITAPGELLFDRVRLEGVVTAGASTARVDGVNRARRADELIVYSPAFDLTTRTNAFGAEAVVTGGAVVSVTDLRGNSAIPRDGFVLSGHGRARQWILQALRPGTAVTLSMGFAAASGDPRWAEIVGAIGGGPRLLAGGQFVGGEGFPRAFTDRRHPRSALGVLADGRVLLLVVDGRQPFHSVGMTLRELAAELRRMGAVEAMNLDGGGSSTLVVGGQLRNLPSDETGERPVADALLVVPVAAPP